MIKLTLNYKNKIEKQDIDIASLRPDKSYDYLIQNRNASLTETLSDTTLLSKYLQNRICPCCEHETYMLLFSKDNLNIVQCDNCHIIYVNPIFDEEKYYEIYKSNEYQTIVKKIGETSHEYRKNRFGKERVDFIEKYHLNEIPKRFLEIGCSTGFVVEEAKERGWDAVGIELNPSAAEFGRKRGLSIHSEPIENISFEHSFSAIALFDVLEHLVNPKEIIKHVHNHLLPKGNLYIYVPNYNSASKELIGVENSHFIWPTHHLTYFTPETLLHFLEDNGFSVFHWETQGLDLSDLLWYLNEKTDTDTTFLESHLETLQFYINSSGHGKNLRMYAQKN